MKRLKAADSVGRYCILGKGRMLEEEVLEEFTRRHRAAIDCCIYSDAVFHVANARHKLAKSEIGSAPKYTLAKFACNFACSYVSRSDRDMSRLYSHICSYIDKTFHKLMTARITVDNGEFHKN